MNDTETAAFPQLCGQTAIWYGGSAARSTETETFPRSCIPTETRSGGSRVNDIETETFLPPFVPTTGSRYGTSTVASTEKETSLLLCILVVL